MGFLLFASALPLPPLLPIVGITGSSAAELEMTSAALGIDGGGWTTDGNGPSVGFRPPPPTLVKGLNELLYRLSREARSPEITGLLGSSTAAACCFGGFGVASIDFFTTRSLPPLALAAATLGVMALDRFAARCCCTMVGGGGAVSPKALSELLYRLSMEARSPEMTGLIPSAAFAPPLAGPPPPPPLLSLPALPVAAAICPTSRRARDDGAGPSGAGAVEP